jgi:two-component sensor histidine kinase
VKNNLQLIVALIRLEARNERRGEKVNLQTLAGRIESLHLLYQALSNDVAETKSISATTRTRSPPPS